MYSTCSPAACTNNENSQHSQARADNRNRPVPVLRGVVGGVVHDIVGEDHRGEDRVTTDKTGAERVGRGRGVRGLHNDSAVTKGSHDAVRLCGRSRATPVRDGGRGSLNAAPCGHAKSRTPYRTAGCEAHAADAICKRFAIYALQPWVRAAPTHRVHAREERLHLRCGIEARLVGKLRRLLLLRGPHFATGSSQVLFLNTVFPRDTASQATTRRRPCSGATWRWRLRQCARGLWW